MVRSLLRALRGVERKERSLWPDYVGQVVTFDDFKVSGRLVVEASKNYHEATLSWMMNASLYRQIRVDREDHICRLVSVDGYGGTIRNRARGGRAEAVYTVAMMLRIGPSEILTNHSMMPVLASDFDAWATSAGWVVKTGGAAERTVCDAVLSHTMKSVRCELPTHGSETKHQSIRTTTKTVRVWTDNESE